VDNPSGKRTEKQAEESVTDPPPLGKADNPAALGSHEINQTNGSNEGSDSNERPPRYFFPRATINEFLAFVLSAASLAVSYLTYRVVADTSDIKSAIHNLSELATQAQRQADATRGQLDEMRDEQRPWVRVIPQIKGALNNNDGALTLVIELSAKNLGRTPAISVIGKAGIEIWSNMFKVTPNSEAKIISLCDEKIDSFWFAFAGEPGNDVIFPDSDGIIYVDAGQRESYNDAIVKTIQPVERNKDVEVSDTIELVFCVVYKGMGDTALHHTGGIISISLPAQVIKNGQGVPASALKLERLTWPAFGGGGYAD
jgi:hypothetical protein